MQSRKIVATFAILKKFKVLFENKTSIPPKKPQNLNVLRILTFPVAFYGKFAIFWWKKTLRSEPANIVFARAQLTNIG